MAAGKRYSAGRIFLQVVPSFNNLQDDIQRHVGKANSGLEKQQEEIGKKNAEARGRGEAKARAKTNDQILRDDEKLAAARLRSFQKFSQMMVGERVKQAEREDAVSKRNAKRWLDREIEIGRGRAKAAQELDKKQRKIADDWDAMTQKRLADEKARQLNHMEWMVRSTLNEAQRKAKIEEDARKAEEKAQASADAANERRRQVVNRRKAADRLNEMRRNDAERRRTAGGASGTLYRKAAAGAATAIGPIEVDADTTPARRRMAALRAELQNISEHVGIDLDTGKASAKIKLIEKELNKLARRSPDVEVKINAVAALAQLALIRREQEKLNRSRIGGALFAGAAGGADDGANSFRIFNYRVLGLLVLLPMLAPLLASAAGALGALATAAIGGAAGLGVMILGFTGLADAVTAMGAVQDSAAKDALANTKAIRTAAKGVRDAEQGVAQARDAAARGAEQASRRVADARKNVAQTERDTTRAMRDALRAQQDAETKLADAQRDATRAQQDLAEARKQAQRDQQDLADRIASGKLDERQALIDLFNAQVEYNAAMADAGSTNLEKEQASIGLERARLAIKGIRQENADLAKEQKKGVEQNQNVVAAVDQVAQANKGVADAQQGVADANERVSDTALSNAERITAAQQGVADALDAQKQQGIDSAISVRDATERLTDAQAAQTEAIQKTGDIGSASMQQLEKAMGKLGPEGRAFATFLFGLRDGFYELRNIAQAGMLPPLQDAMISLMTKYGPQLKAFVGTMATTIGRFFTVFGKALESPIMQTFFETMATYAPIFFTQWGDLFINLMKLVAGLATAFAPFAKEFMDGFVDMSKGWADWAAGLAGSDGFNQFIDYVKKEGPQVLKLIGDLFTIILNIGKGMADTPIFDAIVGFFSFLASIDPKVVATLFTAFTGLAFASQVAAGINALVISIGFLATPIGLIVIGLMAFAVALVWLWNNNETFRVNVQKAWTAIQGYIGGFLDWIQTSFLPWWSDTFLPFLQGIWDAVVAGAMWLWEALKPTIDMIGAIFGVVFTLIKWFWDKILFPTFEAIGSFFVHIWVNYLQPTLRILWEAFGYAFRIIELLWNNVLMPVFRLMGTVLKWVWDYVIYPVLSSIGNAFSFLWEYIVSPVLRLITDAFKTAFAGVVWVWDHILKPMLDAVIKLLQGDFQGAWESTVEAIGGIWNGLQRLVASPINFVIDTVLNKGLFAAFNKVMEFFGSDLRAPHLDVLTWGEEPPAYTKPHNKSGKNKAMFADGGYTGPGGKWQPAGIVHAGEVVWSQEDVRRWGGPAFVDALRQSPGYAIGGMVKPVNAAPRFGWGHYPSGKTHRALDLPVGVGTPVVAPYAGRVIKDGWDSTGFGTHVRLAADNGTYWIFGHLLKEFVNVGQRLAAGQRFADSGNSGNSTGPHLHLEGRMSPYDPSTAFDFTSAFNGGTSVTPPAGQPGVDLPWWADKPLEFLQSAVQTGVNLIPGKGMFSNLLKGLPGKLFGGVREFFGNLIGGGEVGQDDISGGKFLWNGQEVPDNGSQMFDRGGLLQPGVTQVLNMTGKPEPVYTADQLQRGTAGAAAALIGHLEMNTQASEPRDVIGELMYALERVDHGGKYAGRTF